MKKAKSVIKFLLFYAACFAVFVSAGYLYLSKEISPAENSVSDVPYTFPEPSGKGIMFDICGDKTFAYFDFEGKKLKIIIPPYDDFSDEIYGYSIDFTVETDYSFVAALVDYAGGIELGDDEGKTERYTGVQISELLSRTVETEELRREIITAIMKKISDTGIDDGIFSYTVEKTETNLTVPDCYNWNKYIKELCKNGEIIN